MEWIVKLLATLTVLASGYTKAQTAGMEWLRNNGKSATTPQGLPRTISAAGFRSMFADWYAGLGKGNKLTAQSFAAAVSLDDCVIYAGAAHPISGYVNKRTRARVFEYFYGRSIPEGMDMDHSCHVASECADGKDCQHRRCINPTHMVLMSRSENVSKSLDNHRNANITHCHRGHEFTADNTYVSKQGKRDCKACRVERKNNPKPAGLLPLQGSATHCRRGHLRVEEKVACNPCAAEAQAHKRYGQPHPDALAVERWDRINTGDLFADLDTPSAADLALAS